MRARAQDNGYEIAARGRIPASVVEAYHTARETGGSTTSRKTRPPSKSKPEPKRGK
ncbi:Lsr2 family protein [Amycolatopsis mediterranei]|nr:Lsr2 family protein [Amycolatopsis mediterranei]